MQIDLNFPAPKFIAIKKELIYIRFITKREKIARTFQMLLFDNMTILNDHE